MGDALSINGDVQEHSAASVVSIPPPQFELENMGSPSSSILFFDAFSSVEKTERQSDLK